MTAAAITRGLHSRGMLIAACVPLVALCLLAWLYAGSDIVFETRGFVGTWSGKWAVRPEVCVGAALAFNLAIAAILVYFNRVYNLMRSYTQLQSTVFIVIQFATPALMMYFNNGLLLAMVVLLCMWVLFGLYGQRPVDTPQVMLMFFMLSAGSAIDYYFTLYIIVFVVGCMQMRIFRLRTIMATIIGVITPWILLFGFGLVAPSDFELPNLQELVNVLDVNGNIESSVLATTMIFTVFVTIGSLLQNIIKIITYNSHARAKQNFVTVLTVVTCIAVIINSANIDDYLPMLNVCAALQVSHLFGSVHTFARSWVAIVTIISIYLLIFGWNLYLYFT